MTEPSWIKEPPRKILLATDLSARCDRALDRAAALATTWQAELIAVHALERTDDFHATELERRLPSWRRRPDPARIVEDQLRGDLMQAAPKVSVVAEQGEASALLLRVATDRGCDLIVTGIARDETLGRFGLGRTVDRLLRGSRVPLLIVKQRVRGPYNNILVATDFSDSSRYALKAAVAFFPGRKLGIFHAYDTPLGGVTSDPMPHLEAYRKVAAGECVTFRAGAGLADPHGQRFGLIVEDGYPSQLIQQYVVDQGVELVALGTHGRSALFNVLLGSTTKEILASLPCDALIVREPRSSIEGEKRPEPIAAG
jgi:nucleotide-binding universal stress UspA family protein